MELRAISADDVRRAIGLHDELGQEEFLRRYGFRPSRSYGLVVEGRTYPSKAIVGVAHEFATGSPLRSAEFNGGRGQAVPVLERLGFVVESGSGLSGDQQAYMLLWNPKSYIWPDGDRLAILAETMSGNTFMERWSIYANSTKVKIGDRVFLRKAGLLPRGIVASGVVSGPPVTDAHWGEIDGRPTTYVDVDWDAMVESEDVLDLSDLAEEQPSSAWAAPGGGARIPTEARGALESAWHSHVNEVLSSYRARTEFEPSHEQEIQVRYGQAVAKIRRHQRAFRKLLLDNLPHECAFPGCGIASVEVLDAAHRIPDSEGGRATLENGLLLCANHHRAMDSGLLRVDDDWQYEWAEGVDPF